MSLSCGLVGLPSCGKPVIFNAITAASISSYDGSEMNRAVVKLPDQRLDSLIEMYRPRKEVSATLEIVDIPGLEVGPQGNERGSRLLGYIKDVEAVLHVLRCFEYGSVPLHDETIDPVRDIETVYYEASGDPSDKSPRFLEEMIERGELGVKSGKGFYPWTEEAATDLRQRIARALATIEQLSRDA